jgi:hypothetical protein
MVLLLLLLLQIVAAENQHDANSGWPQLEIVTSSLAGNAPQHQHIWARWVKFK